MHCVVTRTGVAKLEQYVAPLGNHYVLLDQSNINIHMEWYKNP
jgi:hypothetical protein